MFQPEKGLMVTKSFKEIMKTRPESEKIMMINFEKALKELIPLKGPNRAKAVYAIYDETHPGERATIAGDIVSPCTKGCAHCCHQYAAIAECEAENMWEEIQRKRVDLSAKKMRYQARLTNHQSFWDRFGKRTRCVLLRDDNSCAIYDQRPLVCRSLISAEATPEICTPTETGGTRDIKYVMNPIGEVLMSVLINLDLKDRGINPSRAPGSTLKSIPQSLLKLYEKR